MNLADKIAEPIWFVMRDLKRSNAKLPAYKMLSEARFEVFTPMRWKLSIKNGKKVRERVPFIQDMLFVRSTPVALDPIVKDNETLQYRFVKGGRQNEYMTVRNEDMDRFINAVCTTDNPTYYLPEELTPTQCNRNIQIIGGPLEGYEGKLLTVRGSKKKRLLVSLSNLFSVAIEIQPEYIRFV